MYTALILFRDLDGEIYEVGETYPRGDVSDERIDQLLTANNRTGKPVIAGNRDGESESDEFSNMKMPDLLAYAELRSIDLSDAKNNDERREILRQWQA